jgi:L-asparaginase II
VEIVRSGMREGVHHGSVVLLAADGTVAHQVGAVDVPMFPRSSNKPLQATAMLLAGLVLADEADLALACASHSGEPEHVRRALGVLASAGLTEDDLRCPPDLPLHRPTAEAVLAGGGGRRRAFMNCSGKHAAMLATCVANGWSTADYTDPAHPLQLAVAATLAAAAGEPVAATAVDGCGAPLYAIGLTGLARAFASLTVAREGSAGRRVADAMRAHPYLVAGTGREDTRLMAAVPGLVCKAGAEGVHAAALPDGRAVALKIEDGAERARLPVMVAALRRLGIDGTGLDDLAEEPVMGGGRPVGCARLIPGAL